MATEYRVKGIGVQGAEYFTSRRAAERLARAVVRGGEHDSLIVEAATRHGSVSDPSSYLGQYRSVSVVYARRTVRA